jgi:hypothetical protein
MVPIHVQLRIPPIADTHSMLIADSVPGDRGRYCQLVGVAIATLYHGFQVLLMRRRCPSTCR